MGQAKLRGTFDQRRDQALEREATARKLRMIIEQLALARDIMTRFQERLVGIERVLTMLNDRVTALDNLVHEKNHVIHELDPACRVVLKLGDAES